VSFTTPSQPDFDLVEWAGLPYPERLRLMCQAWAMQGFGAPGVAYVFYVVKLFLYAGGFLLFTATTPGLGGLGSIGSWLSSPIAFEKAVIWTLLFESTGLGCASGPLTGRYRPPVTAIAYWLRPGTTRLAPFRWVPLTGGYRRTPVDVLLYVAFCGLCLRALVASSMGTGVVLPIVIVLCALGLRDKTVFLCARSEHYLMATFVFLFPQDLFAGSKAVQAALWFGAATSKLNHHFPNVIAVMLSNNPFLRSRRLRTMMYRRFPDDMRGSDLAALMGHGATALEYAFPLVLLLSSGGPATAIALALMVAFHTFILTNFPLGVPLEWNVFFVYSGLVLFGSHASVRVWSMHSPLLIVAVILCLVVVPVLGNLRPDKISFLPSMRYYAGNWGTSLWLWRPSGFAKLDRLVKSAPTPREQLLTMFGEGVYEVVVGRTQAFRSMHLHGRVLNRLLPRAIADIDDPVVRARGLDAFDVTDGELVAGVVLGWNFGDGHLHDESLLAVLQQQCGFEPDELRIVFLESQPAHTPRMHWRLADGARGVFADGYIDVRQLLDVQPWVVGEPQPVAVA
jgi:hypothetical protein